MLLGLHALASVNSSHELLADSLVWLSLMQYKTDYFGRYYGRIEKHSDFYLTDNGHRDPAAELQAAVETFQNPATFIKMHNAHPQCLMPARFNYLMKQKMITVPTVACPALAAWKSNIAAESISIIFASQFVSNPASIMGHTLLKFSKKGQADFLNMTFSYAADVPLSTGAVDYIYSGLFGGFIGEFSEAPYFRKVYEYSNIENRDMWEFGLALNARQIDDLLNIIWELKHNGKINYFFIDENCSFILLTVIQGVFPEKKLISNFSSYVLPHETIKTLAQAGLITYSRYRPSLRKRLLTDYEALSSQGKKSVRKSLRHNKPEQNLGVQELDTLIDYFELQKQRQEGTLDVALESLREEVLLQRSQLGQSERPVMSEPASPLKAHHPYAIEYAYGEAENRKNYFQFTFRPAVHKMMDYAASFAPGAELNFMEIRANYLTEKKYLSIEKISYVDVASAPTFSFIDPLWSWRFSLNTARINDNSCFNCLSTNIMPAFGIAYDYHESLLLQVLVQLPFQVGSDLPDDKRLFAGTILEAMLHMDRFKFLARQQLLRELLVKNYPLMLKTTLESRWHNFLPHSQLALQYSHHNFIERVPDNQEILISVIHDF